MNLVCMMKPSTRGVNGNLTGTSGGLELPEMMTMNDGRTVGGINDWEKRRVELLDILAQEMYGVSPAPVPVSWRMEEEAAAYADKAVERRLTVALIRQRGRFFRFTWRCAVGEAGSVHSVHKFPCTGSRRVLSG